MPTRSVRSSPFSPRNLSVVGALARQAGKLGDLLLRNHQRGLDAGGELRVEERGERQGDARVGVEQAVALREADELPQPLVQLVDDEAVEVEVALEEPHEGGARHEGDLAVAQRRRTRAARA